MAAFLLFLLQFAFQIAVAQKNQTNISLGSSLSPTGNSTWSSHSGVYGFGFYQQGNDYAVGVFMARVPRKTVVWTANRDSPFVPRNSTLSLTTDGRLIVQWGQGDISAAEPSESIAVASMLDSGNFVLYNSAQRIIWQSFDYPTNTLLPGQRLKADQELISSTSEINDTKGIFRLKMQADGNLVQYPVDTPDTAPYSYWASGTDGEGGPDVSLNLNNSGYAYLLNSSKVIKNITDGGHPTDTRTIYFLKIDADGIFRLYSQSLDQANSSIIWASSPDGCSPKGLCGINSFCILQDTIVDCKCLPGFDYVIRGNWRLGCVRNSTIMSCKDENRSANYRIASLDNTAWEDDPYARLRVETKDNCGKACLDDCNCVAAFYKDGFCKMQRLPLRYGRRSLSESNIAMIKVGTPVAPLPPSTSSDHPKTSTKKGIRVDIPILSISLVGLAGLLFVILGLLIYIHRARRNYNYRAISNDVESIENVAPRTFTYAELQRATDNFKEEIGRGGFGTVYKGTLPDYQKAVAVKKLEKILKEGDKEFKNEIRVIGKLHHRNLVQLIGYCLDGPHRLLVYEYMWNGSLDKFLFNSENFPRWDDRIEIALDVARGILYLHEECGTQIIHCDIKPQNLLLDEHQRAKISDFGLSKLLNYDQSRTYTAARGTRGYAAPEWFRRLPVTVKADVYSFGVVLLEIVCRRKNIDWSCPENEAILDEWVYTCFEARELHKLVGDEEIDRRKLERMIKIGLWCTQDEPSLRPTMKKVVLMLEGTVDIPVPPNPTSFLSAI